MVIVLQMSKRTYTGQQVAEILADSSSSDEDQGSDYQQSSDDDEADEIISNASMDNSSENLDDTEATDDFMEQSEFTDTYTSRNGQETWQFNPVILAGRREVRNILRQQAGCTRFARSNVSSISTSFGLYFRNNILEYICKWTNKEGKQVLKLKWNELDIVELKKFIGVLLLIGVYKSRGEEISQLWSKDDGRPIFSMIMPRTRFQELLRCLRFDDASARRVERSNDKLQPIRFLFDMWIPNLKDSYTVGENVVVDEQLVTFRGKCPFRQYIASKPGRYGLKFWALCDCSNPYVYNLQIYTGKGTESGAKGCNGYDTRA